ncbi:MAG TPA: FGGY family carbohydrate kinase [Micromonosporaceae bacterium]|nr:FGGY family carbohydrate kinase [Micromonosporaceae bacterium]
MDVADPLVLAIDQGTSSTKCLLVGTDGEIRAKASSPIDISYPRPGWVEQSPDAIWASVLDSVAKVLTGQDATRVAAVGLSNQRESVLLWERTTGRPLGPMLGWQDQRTVDACERLRAAGHGEQVRQVSGLPLDPMFSALKAGWLLDRYDPDRVRSARGELCLGTVDSWLMYRLGGGHVVEVGNAARTQLLDVDRRQWSGELLGIFGVPRDVLPTVVASAGTLGEVSGLPGLRSGVPLAAVLGDSHAALFAHGARTPGMVKTTYGTGSSVMGLVSASVGAAPGADQGVCRTIAWDAGDAAYAAEGNIRASGAILVWLAGLLGTTPEGILRMAASADSGGVTLVPAFGGLAAPWWDDGAVASMTGLTLGTGPEQLARAAAEAVTFQVNDVVAAITRTGQPVECLLVDGGGSASDTLMQMQADVSGVPVLRARAQDLSALGAAHLAGLTAGVWTADEVAGLPRDRDTFRPAQDGPARDDRVAAWHSALARARHRP